MGLVNIHFTTEILRIAERGTANLLFPNVAIVEAVLGDIMH